MAPYEILEAAADYTETHGWTRCVAENAQGEVCLQGALWRGAGIRIYEDVDVDLLDSIHAAEKVLSSVIDNHWIAMWNDLTCKSKYEAVDALRLAAKLAHEQ
jgi:hypothetical protein